MREGNLQAPVRAPIDWQSPEYTDRERLDAELERVFDICHGCRRCVSLCDAFPTLFDLVDNSSTGEVDGVARADYGKVVEQCYLCDLCAQTKCPYLPPHAWAVDFPHLMLRAKVRRFQDGTPNWRDRLITTTDVTMRAASLPGVAPLANAANSTPLLRKQLDRVAGIHEHAPLPQFHSRTAKKRLQDTGVNMHARPAGRTRGRIALYVTCYGNYSEPQMVEDLVAVFDHNDIPVHLVRDDRCCGMPKLEIGDLESVRQLKEHNIPRLLQLADAGHDLVAPVPSCVLMYKQELPLLFANDADVARVRSFFFDPFEYLWLRHREGLLRTDFRNPLGKVAYHAACHQRVQNFGARTRDLLALVPGTEVTMIERCSGHDGTYAVKTESYDRAMKIARPVVNRVRDADVDAHGSDCPMAGRMIAHGLGDGATTSHPISLLRRAYGI